MNSPTNNIVGQIINMYGYNNNSPQQGWELKEAETVGLKGIRKFGGEGCWRASITSLESPANNTKIQKEN